MSHSQLFRESISILKFYEKDRLKRLVNMFRRGGINLTTFKDACIIAAFEEQQDFEDSFVCLSI